ncbi:unnamed protein product [Cylicostephanus goldi]|uniref:Peptidase M20 dimerisation domain-containing protein n=1 Tax=Cylicostephanus goldi TaxID=71465 RepID=A0A3P7MNG1_CYLGO|nr:unnamed protein product [Cylicostephanus goldi]
MVVDYLNNLWKKRGSPNTFKPPQKPFTVHNVDPDYIREGCSIPITLTFQDLTGKSVLLLPLGAADDMAHSQNEKINKVNYLQGVKTLLAYLLELGKE